MIEQYRTQYDAIMQDPPGDERDYRLAALMTEMERKFRIPTFESAPWESANPDVADLYREVSYARAL